MRDIDKYLGKVSEFAIYPEKETGSENELMYLALGVASEAGEIAGKIKKLYRDDVLSKAALLSEIGDVFWYLVMLCNAIDKSPSDALQDNYEKLSKRALNNTIAGEGDHR
jgi:NTP pyrophosphatase (non-canonical NTP hydrolase)